MIESEFWKKVNRCKHKNLSDSYYISYRCGTPYCGADEIHCLDCGVYISRCGCGSENGLSGWPMSRHIIEERKRIERRRTKSAL